MYMWHHYAEFQATIIAQANEVFVEAQATVMLGYPVLARLPNYSTLVLNVLSL